MNDFTGADLTDQSGKCFVVTGANAGIGFAAAQALAAKNARVVMACRSEERARAAGIADGTARTLCQRDAGGARLQAE